MRAPLAVVTATLAAFVAVAIFGFAFERLRPAHPQVEPVAQPQVLSKAQQGKPAPDFVVLTTASLFDLSKTDKPVFLEVFATWCSHCARETAVIDRLYRSYRSRVEFVAVSGSDTAMDGVSSGSVDDVIDWMQRYHVTYPVGYDPSLEIAKQYLNGGFPTIAIIGRDKIVSYLGHGEIAYDDLDAALRAVSR